MKKNKRKMGKCDKNLTYTFVTFSLLFCYYLNFFYSNPQSKHSICKELPNFKPYGPWILRAQKELDRYPIKSPVGHTWNVGDNNVCFYQFAHTITIQSIHLLSKYPKPYPVVISKEGALWPHYDVSVC